MSVTFKTPSTLISIFPVWEEEKCLTQVISPTSVSIYMGFSRKLTNAERTTGAPSQVNEY